MKLLLGAVAYNPRVVTIWEGMRAYFRSEAKLDLEVALFLSYEAQVEALLGAKIDIAWNTNLAFLQSIAKSERCRPIAMRDSDIDWRTLIIAPSKGGVQSLQDLRGKRLALGSRDSGHAAILPVHFLSELGLDEGRDYESLRFDSDVGKHGDTGESELLVLRAVLDGRAAAGAVGSPFYRGIIEQQIAPEGALCVAWESPTYHHCMFTGRPGLEPEHAAEFARALFAMQYDNPQHRPILDLEGLKAWVSPRLDGYASLKSACITQGFFG
jgi:phosphonate transport system substrate-binding protein